MISTDCNDWIWSILITVLYCACILNIQYLGTEILIVVDFDSRMWYLLSLVMKMLSSVSSDSTRRSFFCRMMEKALSRNDPGRYEIIHIVGQLRPIPTTTTAMGGSPGTLQTVPSPAASSGIIWFSFCMFLYRLYNYYISVLFPVHTVIGTVPAFLSSVGHAE